MDLTQRAKHFEFGENWNEYSALIDERRLEIAAASVRALTGDLRGKTFLDIGSGSGLFSRAALRLGAKRVVAVDIDENSVSTTRKTLANEPGDWTVLEASVFELPEMGLGQFDVVYSWGVLHHTGDMRRAIEAACGMVAREGLFAFSLYERTPLCGLWRIEKRIYRKLPAWLQRCARVAFLAFYSAGLLATGRNPWRKIREQRQRGMDTRRDIHDWLGGYPYESTTYKAIRDDLLRLGFAPKILRPAKVHLFGLFGTGCSEYLYLQRAGDYRPEGS